MKNNNNSMLMASIRVLTRDYKKFHLTFFGIMTTIYLLEFLFINANDTVSIGGIEYVFFVACLVSGLTAFKENYFFFSQNQISKSTMVKAFIIEGFFFGLISSVLVKIYFHIMNWIGALQGFQTQGFADLLPTGSQNTVSGFLSHLIMLFFLYTTVYFLGLLLTTINYRLNWIGRIPFWIAFGIVTLKLFFSTLVYVLSKVSVEELDIPAQLLDKSFFHIIDWIMHSPGNYILSSILMISVCILLGTAVFRGAEIKYSVAK